MMNRFPFSGTIKPTLEFRKEFGRLVFFAGTNQRHDFFLGKTGMIQKQTVDRTTTQCPTGLFGSRSSVSHKGKECPKPLPHVNP